MRAHARLAPLRLLRALLATVALTALLGLGILWLLDRAAPRETPSWSDAAFVPLHQAPGAPEGWSERWVVALEPSCPHCRASLAALAAARDRSGAPVEVVGLLVDTSRPPSDSALARLAADEIRWDIEDRWRRRWSHRVYGEAFCFDLDGRLTRVLPPFERPEDAANALASADLIESP